MLFRKKKKAPAYDWTGKVLLNRGEDDLREFLETYGAARGDLRREW